MNTWSSRCFLCLLLFALNGTRLEAGLSLVCHVQNRAARHLVPLPRWKCIHRFCSIPLFQAYSSWGFDPFAKAWWLKCGWYRVRDTNRHEATPPSIPSLYCWCLHPFSPRHVRWTHGLPIAGAMRPARRVTAALTHRRNLPAARQVWQPVLVKPMMLNWLNMIVKISMRRNWLDSPSIDLWDTRTWLWYLCFSFQR